jgi:aromatic-L-amino-acid decarboxylase
MNEYKTNTDLDPVDWTEFEKDAHKSLTDIIKYLKNIRNQNCWQEIPSNVKNNFKTSLPTTPAEYRDVYQEFVQNIMPYPTGNIHPRFWAWADGTGTPLAMIAEMLASGLNPNVCAGEHSSMYVENQVLDWMKEIMGFPASSSGVFVSGGTMSNLTALIIARNSYNEKIRKEGLAAIKHQLVLYTSEEAHSCIEKAADIIGIGMNSVVKIPTDSSYRIDVSQLQKNITADRKAGKIPFCVVATVGTVNTGAIDPLEEIAAICNDENLWFHIDGAYGSAAKITNEFKEPLRAIEKADSLTFDLHKWFFMPFGIGCLLVKNKTLHRQSFTIDVDYLFEHERGLASGPEMFANFGIEMSRGFKTLPLWFTLKTHGIDKIANIISKNIQFSLLLKSLVESSPHMELMAPVSLNVVCFRFNNERIPGDKLNSFNKELLMRIQESGFATPSYTILKGAYVLRVAIINHRTKREDIVEFASKCEVIGNSLLNELCL